MSFCLIEHHPMITCVSLIVFVLPSMHSKDKFQSKTRTCVFVGYPSGQKGYKVYDLETQKFFVSRDVNFYENIFPFQKPSSEFFKENSLPQTTQFPESDKFFHELPAESFNSPSNPNESLELPSSTPSTENDQLHGTSRNRRPPAYLKNYHYSLPGGSTHSNSVSSTNNTLSLHILLILPFHHSIKPFL